MTEFERLKKEFLEYITVNKMKIRANCTFGLGMFKQYIDETGIDYLRIKVKQAQDFQSHLMSLVNEDGQIKYSKYSVFGAVAGMRAFYDFLKERKLIYSNPFLQVQRIKKKREIPKDLLNEEEMNQLLTHLSQFWKGKDVFERRQIYRAYLVVELMYSTGMSVTELKGIHLNDIDLKRNIVRVTGTHHSRRECILNEYTVNLLKIYVEKVRPFYFVGSNYKAGHNDLSLLFGCSTELPRTINRILKDACESLKLPQLIVKHIRFAVGYHLIRGGADIRYIQEIIGHKNLDTTSLFLKVEKEALKNVLDNFHPRYFGGKRDEKV
jgi:site-specific recombinase XerD